MRTRILHGDCRELLATLPDASVDAVVTDPPAGIAFMGKEWDRDKGGRDEWIAWLTDVLRECYRVAKPGAHAVVWALPRTSGWTHRALEDAGWEVRDCITHLFGSGFPKSLDVSKAIDKAAGAEREVVGQRDTAKGRGDGRRGYESSDMLNVMSRDRFVDITAPATPEAERWQGWHTALKPAAEFWYLARKPLAEKTVAANVLTHGTGALNVDACRIAGTGNKTFRERYAGDRARDQYRTDTASGAVATDQGRWPPNVALDEAAAALLDQMSGERKPRGNVNGTRAGTGIFHDTTHQTENNYQYGDTGGASRFFPVLPADDPETTRFFYCAKASRREREPGCDHPTVKPLALMQWLVRLVTPPGGTVLDPFLGSGTTGIAAQREGFGFIGIEREAEYIEIARRRIANDAPLLSEAAD